MVLNSDHIHFIQGIQRGVVVKTRNVHSKGLPTLVFKRLKDIYGCSNEAEHSSVLLENGGNNFENVTLKQIKEECKKKKRKLKQECTDFHVGIDEADFNDTLMSFKLKIKRMRINKGPSLKMASCVKSEFVSDAETSTQSYGSWLVSDHVKSDPCPESDQSSFAFNSSTNDAIPKACEHILGNGKLELNRQEHQMRDVNELSFDFLEHIKGDINASQSLGGIAEANIEETNTSSPVNISEEDSVQVLPSDTVDGSASRPFSSPGILTYASSCSSPGVYNLSPISSSVSGVTQNPRPAIVYDQRNRGINDNILVSMDNESTSQVCQVAFTTEEERLLSSNVHEYDASEELLVSEFNKYSSIEKRQCPERLLSTRTAISPNSQERLKLEMHSSDKYDDNDKHECKGKLCFNEAESVDLKLGSGLGNEESAMCHDGSAGVETTACPKLISRKAPCSKRLFPHNGKFDCPDAYNTLLHAGTGCSSICTCSESAILFAQRQMHDIESIALRLMNELDSMKEIVEEKFLYEMYQNNCLLNGADEVRTAIKNATRTTHTARKWLSMMSRDCNRFCKLMKLARSGDFGTKPGTRPQKRRVTFADENGGSLCHVKLFDGR